MSKRGKHAAPSLIARLRARRERNRQTILRAISEARTQRKLAELRRSVSMI